MGILISGYIETGKDSKFDFGPMNTTISANEIEGARFRIGGLTTAQLNPHWFARGYVAYGTKDEKVKYSGEVEYSFNKKKFHSQGVPHQFYQAEPFVRHRPIGTALSVHE